MPKKKKTDYTALAVEELEWLLQGADGNIVQSWEQVERAQRWITTYQEQLTEAMKRYNEAVTRKEGIRYALTVLRNHEES